MIRSSHAFAVALLLLISGGVISFGQQPKPQPQGAPQLPPPRSIPGITAEDPHPRGCVDCHVYIKEMDLDVRLSTQMASLTKTVEPALLKKAQAAAPPGVTLKGQHPSLPASAFRDIPNSCLMCHGPKSQVAPPMARLTHLIHLTGGAQNIFLTVHQGDCTHCHKLGSTGAWSIPSGPERPK
jgi:hypothetical protein